MLAKISESVKEMFSYLKTNLDHIILVAIVILFILLSFASGYIVAKYQNREPIKIENINNQETITK